MQARVYAVVIALACLGSLAFLSPHLPASQQTDFMMVESGGRSPKRLLIIGSGLAGLTAALEAARTSSTRLQVCACATSLSRLAA